MPLDINVAFPPDPGGTDGPYPLIVWGHGYGGAKIGFGASGSTPRVCAASPAAATP